MRLSFVVPVYNEEKTVAQLLEKVLALNIDGGFEVITVNDGSKDKSLEVLTKLAQKDKRIKVLDNEKNLGKSRTVKRGLLASQGDYVVVQDADLEYIPSEVLDLLELAQKEDLDVVYGNRFGKKNKVIYYQNYFGNKFLSLASNIFTFPRIRTYIPDMEVCYKMIRGEIIREIAQSFTATSNFGFEPEVTAKLSKYRKDGKRLKFGIVPISYLPRSVEEGKHMKAFRDGFKALKEILYYNLIGR